MPSGTNDKAAAISGGMARRTAYALRWCPTNVRRGRPWLKIARSQHSTCERPARCDESRVRMEFPGPTRGLQLVLGHMGILRRNNSHQRIRWSQPARGEPVLLRARRAQTSDAHSTLIAKMRSATVQELLLTPRQVRSNKGMKTQPTEVIPNGIHRRLRGPPPARE